MYEDMVLKFAEHFIFIASAMDRIGDNHDEIWDEEDGFYYDVLRLPDGQASRLRVRSIGAAAGGPGGARDQSEVRAANQVRGGRAVR